MTSSETCIDESLAPPQCPRCDYNLTGLNTNRCPECGATFAPSQILREQLGIVQPLTPWDLANASPPRPRIMEHASSLRKLGLRVTSLLRTWALIVFWPAAFARAVPRVPDLDSAWSFRWIAHGTSAVIILLASLTLDLFAWSVHSLTPFVVGALFMTLLLTPWVEVLGALGLAALAPATGAATGFHHWRYVLYYHSAFLPISAVAGAIFLLSMCAGPIVPLTYWPFAVSAGAWWLALLCHLMLRTRSWPTAILSFVLILMSLTVVMTMIGVIFGAVAGALLLVFAEPTSAL